MLLDPEFSFHLLDPESQVRVRQLEPSGAAPWAPFKAEAGGASPLWASRDRGIVTPASGWQVPLVTTAYPIVTECAPE
jgi:hypothetical protein